MNNFLKIFLILFCLMSVSANAQIYDYQRMRILPHGFINAKMTVDACEKERLILKQNNVKEIELTDSSNRILQKFIIDKEGRCSSVFNYGVNKSHTIYNYDANGNLLEITSDEGVMGKIEYEGNKPVHSYYAGAFINDAVYDGDKLVKIYSQNTTNFLNDPSPGSKIPLIVYYGTDTIALRIDISDEGIKEIEKNHKKKKVKSDSPYKSSIATDTLYIGADTYDAGAGEDESENSENADENALSVFDIFIRGDTVIYHEMFMNQNNKAIYRDNRIIRTENDNEDYLLIITDYFYKPNGLIDYTSGSQKYGKSEGRINYKYIFYEN